MENLNRIQNLKLRNFLQNYKHFTGLKEEERLQYIEKIVLMPDTEQEKVYSFLYEENEKEKLRILQALNEKLAELSKVLKKIKVQESEMAEKESEEEALIDLENELNS